MDNITRLVNKKSVKKALLDALQISEKLQSEDNLDGACVILKTKDGLVHYTFEDDHFKKVTLIGMLQSLSEHLESEHLSSSNEKEIHDRRIPMNLWEKEDETILLSALECLRKEGSAGVAVTILHEDSTRTQFFSQRHKIAHAVLGSVVELRNNILKYLHRPREFSLFMDFKDEK